MQHMHLNFAHISNNTHFLGCDNDKVSLRIPFDKNKFRYFFLEMTDDNKTQSLKKNFFVVHCNKITELTTDFVPNDGTQRMNILASRSNWTVYIEFDDGVLFAFCHICSNAREQNTLYMTDENVVICQTCKRTTSRPTTKFDFQKLNKNKIAKLTFFN